jgi:Ca2+-binding RTX toxin-like protein
VLGLTALLLAAILNVAPIQPPDAPVKFHVDGSTEEAGDRFELRALAGGASCPAAAADAAAGELIDFRGLEASGSFEFDAFWSPAPGEYMICGYLYAPGSAAAPARATDADPITVEGDGPVETVTPTQTAVPSVTAAPTATATATATPAPRSPFGTADHDVLLGTLGPDLLCGLSGDDTLSGLSGDDRLFGGNCPATAAGLPAGPFAGAAASRAARGDRAAADGVAALLAAAISDGSDTLNGGDGNDVLGGGSGGDRLRGDAGDDRLEGGTGSDSLAGGTGDDVLRGGKGRNTYLAGSGNDTVDAFNRAIDVVDCGAGRRDRATVDRRDRVRGCERVRHRR